MAISRDHAACNTIHSALVDLQFSPHACRCSEAAGLVCDRRSVSANARCALCRRHSSHQISRCTSCAAVHAAHQQACVTGHAQNGSPLQCACACWLPPCGMLVVICEQMMTIFAVYRLDLESWTRRLQTIYPLNLAISTAYCIQLTSDQTSVKRSAKPGDQLHECIVSSENQQLPGNTNATRLSCESYGDDLGGSNGYGQQRATN